MSNIHKGQSECLNQSDDHTWEHALTPSTTTFLESDVDEQLLLFISFMQPIKLNALVIQSPGGIQLDFITNFMRTLINAAYIE